MKARKDPPKGGERSGNKGAGQSGAGAGEQGTEQNGKLRSGKPGDGNRDNLQGQPGDERGAKGLDEDV